MDTVKTQTEDISDNNQVYDSEFEKMQHQRAMQTLAMHFGISLEDIEKQ